MILEIKHQERYSRGELLLRTLFGFFYILLPHAFLLLFVGIAAGVLHFLAFWVILFTGRYPESWFEFQVKQMRWNLRLTARLLNLSDGYPRFGLNAEDEHVIFEVPYPERVSRGLTLLRALFGVIYVGIPHGIVLVLLHVAVMVVQFLAWWVVLITGKYPRSMFDFMLYYLRWNQRVSLYLGYMTDRYPPFSGEPDEVLEENAPSQAQNEPREQQSREGERGPREDPGRFMPPSPGEDSGKGEDKDEDDSDDDRNKP